jgi:glutaredoxin
MNQLAESILRLADTRKQGSLTAEVIAAELRAGGGVGDLASEIRAIVSEGLLREERGNFSITEDGRLALLGPHDLTLYTRPGCHLCDEAKAKIAPLLRKRGATLREVNIDDDPILRTRYNEEVPVLFLAARKVAKFHVDVEQLERQLASAEK